MLFQIILIIFILVIFRKQRIEMVKTEAKKELIFCLLWLLFYFILAVIGNAYHIDIINEISNWLFFVLFPLLLITWLRKENMTKVLKDMGLRCFDKATIINLSLICVFYIIIIVLVFSFGEEATNTFTLESISKIVVSFPIWFALMLCTAAFTEEFFFRGLLQKYMTDFWHRPYLAILLTSVLFGLYHFPFAYYLWDETAGSVIASLQMVMMEQAISGIACGLIYYKCKQNLWSSIVLHACTNAIIMSLGVAFSGM